MSCWNWDFPNSLICWEEPGQRGLLSTGGEKGVGDAGHFECPPGAWGGWVGSILVDGNHRHHKEAAVSIFRLQSGTFQ